MKVSVCIVTYNHEAYIEQALDSVLEQETDFDYEIIIGEDDSTDGTREIVKAYKEKYPDKIRLFLNDRKNVIYIDGIATGRWNFLNNIKHANGEYITLLDGDDYWVDNNKLQSQVNELDRRSSYSLCFHSAMEIDARTNSEKIFNELGDNAAYTVDDVIDRWFVSTASIMFRKKSLGELPRWFSKIYNADYALQLLLANRGNFYYINKIMAVYRRHDGGLSANCEGLWHTRNLMHIYRYYDKHTKGKYSDKLSKKLAYGFESVSYGNRNTGSKVKFGRSLYYLYLSMYYFGRLGSLPIGKATVMIAKWVLNRPRVCTYHDFFKKRIKR